MNKKARPSKAARALPRPDVWERSWQEHGSKVGLPGYELPVGGAGGDEREFLAQARTLPKEKWRLECISDEFARAFNVLHPAGPAVTVFGSARFKEDHPYYQLDHRTRRGLRCGRRSGVHQRATGW